MKVIDHINRQKIPWFHLKFYLRLKGKTISSIYDHLDPLMEFKPSFINVLITAVKPCLRRKAMALLRKWK